MEKIGWSAAASARRASSANPSQSAGGRDTGKTYELITHDGLDGYHKGTGVVGRARGPGHGLPLALSNDGRQTSSVCPMVPGVSSEPGRLHGGHGGLGYLAAF